MWRPCTSLPNHLFDCLASRFTVPFPISKRLLIKQHVDVKLSKIAWTTAINANIQTGKTFSGWDFWVPQWAVGISGGHIAFCQSSKQHQNISVLKHIKLDQKTQYFNLNVFNYIYIQNPSGIHSSILKDNITTLAQTRHQNTWKINQ